MQGKNSRKRDKWLKKSQFIEFENIDEEIDHRNGKLEENPSSDLEGQYSK